MEDEFVPDIKAFERVSGGILGTKIDRRDLKGKKFDEISRKLKGFNMVPEEKLSIAVDAIARNYKDSGIFSFSEENINEMVSKIHRLNRPKVINPLGYVLGYVATNGGKNKDNLVNVINKVKKGIINDANAQHADVIRYATLWINL